MLTVIRNTPLECVTVTLTIRAPFSPFEVECCQPLSPVLLTPIFYHILPVIFIPSLRLFSTIQVVLAMQAVPTTPAILTIQAIPIKLSIKKIFRCRRMDGIAENLSLNHHFLIYSCSLTSAVKLKLFPFGRLESHQYLIVSYKKRSFHQHTVSCQQL